MPNTFHGSDSGSDLSVSFSMWQFQVSLSSIVIPSDFVVATCFIREPSIKTEGGSSNGI